MICFLINGMEYIMKLNESTIKNLKSLAELNPRLFIKKGNVLDIRTLGTVLGRKITATY